MLKANRPDRSYIPDWRRNVLLLLPMLLLLMSSCGGKGKEKTPDNRDTLPAESEQSVKPEMPDDIVMTASGIGIIHPGMSIDSIPERYAGLYDNVVIEEGYESNMYVFRQDEEILFTAYQFGGATLDVISADSPKVYVNLPEGGVLRLGDEFAPVLSLPGVVCEWESLEGDGMWVWQWRGLWLQPDQSRLPELLSRQLYDPASPPDQEAFTSDVVVGYIGTGLPW